MIGTDKFITGKLFIKTGPNDVNIGSIDSSLPFDVYLGEHMTIFHKQDHVWIGLPYNKRSNYDDNFKEEVNYDENDHSSELRDFFWNHDNLLLCTGKADFNRTNISINKTKRNCKNTSRTIRNRFCKERTNYLNRTERTGNTRSN